MATLSDLVNDLAQDRDLRDRFNADRASRRQVMDEYGLSADEQRVVETHVQNNSPGAFVSSYGSTSQRATQGGDDDFGIVC